ncbi:MaoC/PaaZ C-terminal domain-containing protein [Thalassotalea ponticola]|uniref:MaoC/PaaZ C-terminal domain-containing protein n=1 Tax=Thalassotalea ponticola TaxID=1523392 RepID=UPI0025B4BEC0|nr:MaoC/PaaZ C-terminal domain-containing protein [Thalassotalea ponticola]MDN3653846.1 MaoC/PaaZ C-terminal domain-containing protein [Thalassotalea ponticola]
MYHYFKLLTKRRRSQFFNEFSVSYDIAPIKQQKIDAFRQFYDLADDQQLPASYAFIAGFEAMLNTLSHQHFAFAPLGLIHLSAEFKQFAPIDYQRPFSVDIKVKQNRRHPLGKLVQLESKFFQDHHLCLINTNCMLKKLTSASTDSRVKGQQTFSGTTDTCVNADTARAYAKVSYDYNPIHISKHLAKLFGLPGAIMHGMYFAHWLLIRENIHQQRVKFEFKKPCLLPTEVGIAQRDNHYHIFSGSDDLHLVMKTFDSAAQEA